MEGKVTHQDYFVQQVNIEIKGHFPILVTARVCRQTLMSNIVNNFLQSRPIHLIDRDLITLGVSWQSTSVSLAKAQQRGK